MVLAVVAGTSGQLLAQDTSSLSYKVVPKWNIVTPTEMWSNVSGTVGICHANGNGFAAVVEGQNLVVDTNGNGKVSHKVKGVRGTATLKAKDANGKKFKYALRFKKDGAAWKFASSGVMKGRVKGTPVTLLDFNCNGVWNEVGVDGMIVGKGSTASYLSKVVNLGGELFNIEVNADGKSVTTTPFEGEAGRLNLRKGFKSRGTLVAAVVKHSNGQYSFNLASAKNGMKVPAGSYTLVNGFLKKGGSSVRMRAGRMQPIVVAAEQKTSLKWGAKLDAEFSYSREGDKITIQPTSLKFYGKAGVEFYDWQPNAKSPKFLVKDSKSGAELTSGRFGGC
jgi:hypothetical protein